MSQKPQQQPTGPTRGYGRTEIEPMCDEESGGGGSATDTRDRGLPGGHPGGARQGDCEPIARGPSDQGETKAVRPTPAEPRR